MRKVSDVELRGALIAAARTMVARDGDAKFSLNRLYAESGISRTAFRRCFASKAELFAAIVGGDVQVLGEMAEAMVPAQTLKVSGGADVAATPAVDAWLERRLRVFERALAALESRLERSERLLQRDLALLQEKIAEPVPPVAETQALPASVAEPAVEAPSAPVTVQTFTPRENEEPVSDREIEDFLANARAAAKAASVPPPKERSLALPRWIAWMGVGLVTLLVCAGLALGNAARATQIAPDSGTAYRAVPPDDMGRMMALADSGDARAQTLLALAYLRGRMLPGDDQAAMRWSSAAAEQGEPAAQYLLGALLSKKDAPRAFSWFQEAALHGNLKAMHNLAIAYAQGEGVSEDDKRAAAWFGRAAAQGYIDSQFDLAVLFERGQGVSQNRIAALKWYLIAAAHGDGPAAARAVQLRGAMPADDAARAVRSASAFLPQPHDQLANALTSP
jgi:TPR repeat protein